ncbi:hypothetical protein B0T17DRAFT_259156 [Bombardia bombarda]|uniref:Transcription factor domain-containing protein n=1 Tax=Bombardia bombarda TaxID=252184 RepID=A0AA40C530_9PEZI|nr:hypothetical protein B0T17DRAFT_259156 [Bombardia bombarda]
MGKMKVPCDGQRPICHPCQRKKRECRYIAAPGMSRYAGMRAEVQRLQTELSSQQSTMPDRMMIATASPPSPHETDEVTSPMQLHRFPQDGQSTALAQETKSPSRPAPSTSPQPAPSRVDELSPYRTHTESASPEPIDTVSPFDSRAVTRFLQDRLDVIQHSFVYFVDYTDFLFCSYTQAETDIMLENLTKAPVALKKAQLCQLCAMASVGAHFSRGGISTELEDYFYDVAKVFFDDCIEESPPAALRVCALLVTRNIVTRPSAALAYIELGLGLSRMLGLFERHCPPSLSALEWLELKRMWWSLLTWQFWLQATLDWRPEKEYAAEPLTFEDVYLQSPIGINDSEFFQREMAKIAILKQNMVQILSQEDASLSSFSSLRRSLDAWYGALPPDAQISGIANSPILSPTRFKLYYIHLMHLGALLLLFRRLVLRCGDTENHGYIPNDLASCLYDGLQAARHSARICLLLEMEGGSVRHYWILIFQSYLASCILLHKSFQKLLLGRLDNESESDAALMRKLLDLLETYAVIDPIARNFHQTLQEYVDLLQELTDEAENLNLLRSLGNGTGSGRREEAGAPSDNLYLLTSVPGKSQYHVAAREVLGLVGQPFGDKRVRPEGAEFLYRNTIINHEECSLGIHRDWLAEFNSSETAKTIAGATVSTGSDCQRQSV